MPVSGSTAAPDQFAPPPALGRPSVPWFPPGTNSDGGVYSGPILKFLIAATAIARISGVKSARSSIVTPCYSNGAGLVGNGCVAAACSPGTSEVAGPVSAVIIGRGGVERQVHVPQFFVGAVGRPSADLSCVRPRVVLPRFVAHLTRPRDRVKCPLQFSRPRIQPARPPGNLLLEDVVRRDRSRRDDRVAHDDGR